MLILAIHFDFLKELAVNASDWEKKCQIVIPTKVLCQFKDKSPQESAGILKKNQGLLSRHLFRNYGSNIAERFHTFRHIH